ncbi:hypothetical protein J1N35_044210 [Gossypium stocksii]|uniref:Uncharacterized protein n=1 Tax=Gossypium stocksii TaxID=47602 RepID=A0A9D3U8L2_9ROSI|nr:hypothetical protein J1N35_044210 [Gossypium stocksii]
MVLENLYQEICRATILDKAKINYATFSNRGYGIDYHFYALKWNFLMNSHSSYGGTTLRDIAVGPTQRILLPSQELDDLYKRDLRGRLEEDCPTFHKKYIKM